MLLPSPRARTKVASLDACFYLRALHNLDTSVSPSHRFISHIFRRARMSTECNIIALVYINRAIALTGMPLGVYNWRPAVLMAMILAQKVWDDKSLRASCFTQICPEYSKDQIKK